MNRTDLITPNRVNVCELLCIYFALNPDETLTNKEAKDKFGASSLSSIWKSCQALEERGMVTIDRSKREHEYSIGPVLRDWVKSARALEIA